MNQPNPNSDERLTRGAKAVGLAMLIPMSVVPIGVGLSVLGFLWFGQDRYFGPPLFFKIFGSFIALGFVGFGTVPLVAACYGSTAASRLRSAIDEQRPADQASGPRNLACPHCGATVQDQSDISAAGDVRCRYCQGWFNTRTT